MDTKPLRSTRETSIKSIKQSSSDAPGGKSEIGACGDHTMEAAEQCHGAIVKQLASSDCDMQSIGTAFDRLRGFVEMLARENEQLKAAINKNDEEQMQLETEFEEIRHSMENVIKNLPPGVLPPNYQSGDPVNDASAINGAVTNLLQNLAKAEGEEALARKMVEDMAKEMDKERVRLEGLKKATRDALSTYKELFGDKTGVGSLVDMLNQLRKMLDDERRGKGEAQRQLDQCRKIIEELKKEFQDVNKVLKQLCTKCVEINRNADQLGVKPAGPPPTYKPEAEQADLFNKALAWLMDITDKLVQALGSTKKRIHAIEGQQQKIDNNVKKAADDLKRAMKEMADVAKRGQEADGQLRQEQSANDGAKKHLDGQKALNDHHLNQLKQFCKDEDSRSKEMADLLKALAKDLKEALKKVKDEQAAHPGNEPGLVKGVEEVLKELENMQRQYSGDTQAQQQRGKQLKADEDELKKRLKDAKDRLKAASDKKKALSDKLDRLKDQMDKVLKSEHAMEDKLPVFNEKHDKIKDEIVDLKIENSRLEEKAKGVDGHMETRTQMLKQLQDREKQLEAEMDKLQKENDRLKWGRTDSKEEPLFCLNCENAGDLQKEVDALRDAIRNKKKEKDELAQQLEDEMRELDRLKQERGTVSSTSSDASTRIPAHPESSADESEPGKRAHQGKLKRGTPRRVTPKRGPRIRGTPKCSTPRRRSAPSRRPEETPEESEEPGDGDFMVSVDANVHVSMPGD